MKLHIRNRYPLLLAIVLVVVGLDQWTKYWIVKNLAGHQTITVLDRFFHIVHVHNSGAAFGMLSDWAYGSYFLTGVSILAIVGIILYFFAVPVISPLTKISLAMILGGALGNLIDRLRYGYVVDFVDWHIDDYHWPAFNIADSSISVAVALLVLDLILDLKRSSGNAGNPNASHTV